MMIWIILIFGSLTFAQLNTYDLIMEYEQECYADSSLYEYLIIYDGNKRWESPCEDWIGFNAGECEKKWIHKEPTWDGFREFVKKRRLTIHLLK